ncbi:MAG: PQQ-dependent sugar dehydrogenase [Verrucomicrobiales bacterium]|jgi:quinoprotein glucose dehydrogenase|nr:PQQ-dependent sugar dehydrogenase [Verrucomicrobiales bacterium]
MTRFLASVLTLLVTLPAMAELPPLSLQPIYGQLEIERPISVQIPNDDTKRRFLVEQTGKVKLLPQDETSAESSVFLDLTDSIQVEKDFEEGLLGLAFHPAYGENGKFYVTFSRQGPKRLVLAEFEVSADNPNVANPDSERIILEVQQPEWNHNSGNLFFGPKDGLLYVCVGDGGMKNGVFMLSQKLTRWNGKVLRIDVDSRTASLPYGIPSDNPFVNEPNACPEIYAYGLRNPWGAAMDPETGLFYLADVGQDLYEEINLIEKGGNYGWEIREATHKFHPRDAMLAALGRKPKPEEETGFIKPIHEYSRADGLSITGGYVYRGEAIPELQGHFLYGDWRFGNLWALHYSADEGKVVANHHFEKPADLKAPTVQPTGFYPDENGEALVLDWRGSIFRIVKADQ